ncbi:MAG: HAMP domain-containing histidine kinase [Methylophaga nitratireducenticrescens]|uniref:sensor histidine kinase n=1 Tax=Methylophaga sp. SB9B TaxID=2570356 RepID=UPI0010A8754E|nr:HAMP domain-containing sensor histidine kinase [Methylophaga sp. SB9B]THF70413.1 MAG: HAMP domain-containing histidine kinase [Methylophaga nitratireducenticrescens]THK40869.1 HAMP domain-containing histidine kinase [Methylophaga sp. SB9B]
MVLADLRTLVLLLAVTSFVSAIALYLFYRLLPEVPGLKQAAIAGACQSIASIFLVSRDFIDPMLSILVSNAAYFLASAFYYQAVRLFCDLAMAWRWPVIILGTLYPLFILFPGNENLGERIIISSIGLASLSLMTSWVLWQDKARLPGRRGLAITFGVIALICGTRILSILIEPIGSMSFLDFNRSSMIFIWGIVTSIAVTVGVIVMTSERLREQLKIQLREVTVAHDVANNALREQKNFLAMLSHEFKTPLSIIKANADAVTTIDNPPASFIKESLERIQQTSMRLNGLVDGCLNDQWISHTIENNELSMTKLNLAEMLRELCHEYDIRFINHSSADTAQVKGDRNLIPILFSRLFDNARKYAHHHDTIEVRLLQTADTITVQIYDDGPGIAEEEHERIFDKYYRVPGETRQHGSGLGLFFVKRIVEQHGGMINVECRQGTTFTVMLPALGDY